MNYVPSKIIDVHTHAWPEKVAARAQEHLEAIFKVKFVGEPTVATLLASMERCGISISVVCAVATRPEQVPGINDWMVSIRSGRVRSFAAWHPDFSEGEKEIERLRGRVDGFKLQPEFQNFYVDDEKVFPFYAALERAKLPVLFHCGKELSGTMLVRSSPDRLIKVRRAFPKLVIIAGHFGGFDLWDDVEKHLLGEDVYLDTSYFLGFVPDERVRRMIRAHRPDRLLFGTDFPLVDPAIDIGRLSGLNIADDLKEGIFYRNAERLLAAN